MLITWWLLLAAHCIFDLDGQRAATPFWMECTSADVIQFYCRPNQFIAHLHLCRRRLALRFVSFHRWAFMKKNTQPEAGLRRAVEHTIIWFNFLQENSRCILRNNTHVGTQPPVGAFRSASHSIWLCLTSKYTQNSEFIQTNSHFSHSEMGNALTKTGLVSVCRGAMSLFSKRKPSFELLLLLRDECICWVWQHWHCFEIIFDNWYKQLFFCNESPSPIVTGSTMSVCANEEEHILFAASRDNPKFTRKHVKSLECPTIDEYIASAIDNLLSFIDRWTPRTQLWLKIAKVHFSGRETVGPFWASSLAYNNK